MFQPIARVLCALALGLMAGTALAERYVVVNGQRLTSAQIAHLERIRCNPIPNGNYWLNMSTGVWGYANNPRPIGHISDPCRGVDTRRPSLSERGMLFGPGDYLR